MTWTMVVRIGLIGAIGWAVMQPTLAGCRAYRDWQGSITGWACGVWP